MSRLCDCVFLGSGFKPAITEISFVISNKALSGLHKAYSFVLSISIEHNLLLLFLEIQ